MKARQVVQQIIAKFGDRAKTHFNKDKNYTQKSEDVLAKLVTQWEKKGLTAPTAPTTPVSSKVQPKKAAAPVQKNTKQLPAPKSGKSAGAKAAEVVSNKKVAQPISSDKGDLYSIKEAKGVLGSVKNSQVGSYISGAIDKLEAAEAILNGTAPKLIAPSNDALKAEARELSRSISGVREIY